MYVVRRVLLVILEYVAKANADWSWKASLINTAWPEREVAKSGRERLTASTAVFSTKGSYKASNFSSSKKK